MNYDYELGHAVIVEFLLQVDNNHKLGEWAGLCKLDAEGNARKVVRCSAVAVRDWGKESPAHDVVQEYIKSQKA